MTFRFPLPPHHGSHNQHRPPQSPQKIRSLDDLQATDIAACWGTGLTSRLISLGTSRPVGPRELRCAPSHLALICEHNTPLCPPVWVESTSMCEHDCLVHHARISGAQMHEPELRLVDYLRTGGRVDIYRVSPIIQRYTDFAGCVRRLSRILIEEFVRPRTNYDTRGALLSGTKCLQLTSLIPGTDVETLFCSEMVAVGLMHVGLLNRCNATRMNPARLMRILVRTGVYQLAHSFRSIPDLYDLTTEGQPA